MKAVEYTGCYFFFTFFSVKVFDLLGKKMCCVIELGRYSRKVYKSSSGDQ